MAIPKVFVSSTCYDLQEERTQLERFISGYGFQPILSEYSGVYYDVDTHTHESCVNEVTHCDLFVLIISGRYGGKYNNGNGESITQAEYNRAKELGLPIFTFVKADVFSAQHYYKANIRAKGEEFAKQITYPAIEKQDDAVSIFSFIESVSHASTNNGLETYQSFSDIENHLKKQWAGMFFTFLKKRKEQENVEDILSAVQKLAGSTTVLESLVESLHKKNVGVKETSDLIFLSEVRQATLSFYSTLHRIIGPSILRLGPIDKDTDSSPIEEKPLQITPQVLDKIAEKEVTPDWSNYIKNTEFFQIQQLGDRDFHVAYRDAHLFCHVNEKDFIELKSCYERGIKHSTKEMRRAALFNVFEKYVLFDID